MQRLSNLFNELFDEWTYRLEIFLRNARRANRRQQWFA